jgi:hypothetical protein
MSIFGALRGAGGQPPHAYSSFSRGSMCAARLVLLVMGSCLSARNISGPAIRSLRRMHFNCGPARCGAMRGQQNTNRKRVHINY